MLKLNSKIDEKIVEEDSMILYLIRKNELTTLRLPSVVQGNYFLTYNDNNEKINLVNIEAEEGKWNVKSNIDANVLIDGAFVSSATLTEYNLYQIKTSKETMYLFTMPSSDQSFGTYEITNVNELIIGKANNNSIIYSTNLVSENHAKITKTTNWVITNLDNKFGTYVNKTKITQKVLEPGDTIFIMGLKIIFMGEFFAINNPNNLVNLNGNIFVFKQTEMPEPKEIKEDPYLNLYEENDYFEKAPRFITQFERQTVKIDSPPDKKEDNETPLLYTIGPMMTMGMTSMVTMFTAINGIVNEEKTISSSMPTLVMSFAMIMTMVFWPMLSHRFQRKQDKKKEKQRQEKYKKYLQRKSDEIQTLMNKEKQILIENNVPLEECQNIILNKKRNLWEKEINQNDFLTVRLGTGSIKPNLEIIYPEEHFTMSEDNLKDLLNVTISKKDQINDVPVKISLAEKNISALIGEEKLTDKFMDSILLQLMTFHSYHDLKIVYFSKGPENKLNYLKMAPHIFNDNRTFRFYSETPDDAKEISNYLVQILNQRKYTDENKISTADYKYYTSYYLIVVDDYKLVKNTNIIKEILSSEINYGFSVIFRSKSLSSLPKECRTFITISGENGKTSGFFENELVEGKQQAFSADLNIQGRVNMTACINAMNKIPLRTNNNAKNLPKVISFLEMYNVGKVEQLNSLYKWQDNNPVVTLTAPVGVDEDGELFKLDLHEKSHGPHGLVAGMTGSGKSEFIITYILSLAVNYHPHEVSFVLIDYKGGGLAGAFENRETGISLPHLAGTITNLDTVEMNRALASIRSELRRRQKLFNEARDKLGESTIDIYKYQKLYREGGVEKPISHLFIISDEFAELKTQQPEFMKELISTARIGRSLGVHLILATQKPSGVVDDQIWSNSKFRVCLKVQDKADSKDMIGVPDAASLVDTGRFYLQVGYNEFFALGQSAWCGAPYYPKEKRQKKVDNSLYFIDNTGKVIKSVSDNKEIAVKAQGEEITNIIKYLINIAKTQNLKVDRLWLNKIPEVIFISGLRTKYDYIADRNIINPIIGEFDDPNNQRQGLLTLPLSKDGNTIIYGTADSGKEDLLSTIIYSTIIDHSADEVNFYILDFGSEILRIFEKAPQVGDFVTSGDSEKITNLFKMLNSIIETRKEKLVKYNGDFRLYNKKEQTPLPTIIVMINNYEAFQELYETENEVLTALSRECFKYGIVLILTASAVSSVRYKLSQNFKQLIALQLNDQLDYTQVVGKTNGVYPSEILGRGLVRLDTVYEFQTAFAKEKTEQTEFLKNVCQELLTNAKFKARAIPVLPNKITLDLLLPKMVNNDIPIGVYKEDLSIATYNFKNNYCNMISSIDPDIFSKFVNPLIQLLKQKYSVLALDTNNIIEKTENLEYHSTKFDDIIIKLNEIITKQNEIYAANNYDINALNNQKDIVCIITGISNFLNRLNPENKKLFEQMITKGIDIKKVIFIIVDTADQLKAFEYNDWYKTAMTKNSGIWIGNGISEQMALKTAKLPKAAKEEITNDYGFIVNKGMAKFAKLLEGEKNGK